MVGRTLDEIDCALASIATGVVQPDGASSPPRPRIGIVLVEAPDLPRAQEVLRLLAAVRVGAEVVLLSALRAPDELLRFARTTTLDILLVSSSDGGVAAALLASASLLPVVALPLTSAAPCAAHAGVATVGGSDVAAVDFALRTLARDDESLRQRLADRADAQREAFRADAAGAAATARLQEQ